MKYPLRLIHKDHPGSYNKITKENGRVVEEYSIDPWGRGRNPDNWTLSSVPADYLFDRYYTGHEYLDAFGLKPYDPTLAPNLPLAYSL